MTDAVERLKAALADHYRVDRELGAGGMATVYLAEDLKHGRRVAVKVLRADLAASLGPERFLREVRIAANLQHPHVVPLYDSGQADGFLYYVMPFVDGPSLRQKLLREGELPIADAVRMLRDVADAMAYAHRHGVVHRDLKPENIMLSERHALVTDFGVAKAVSAATGRQTLTTAGVVLGTPTYMAPEQATGDPHTDHRADIYAFGVMAYELLTGQPPFTGPSPQAVLGAHVTTPAEPVTKHRSSIPPVLAALVMTCLEKKPADRWQSADQLITQLEAVLTSSSETTPTNTRPVTGVALAQGSLRRLWLGLGVASVVLVAIAAGLWARGARKTPAHNRVVVLPFENRTGDPAWDHLSMLAADYIAQSLLQTGLLQVVPMTAAGQVARVLGAQTAGEGAALPQRVARETGAGLALSGAYYLAGDSLRFVVELTDAAGERLLASKEMLASGKDPMPGLQRLRQVIAGTLAVLVDPAMREMRPLQESPPSYETAKVMQEGYTAFFRQDFQEAGRLLQRAFALDTTYETARLWLGITYGLLNEWGAADSLFRLIEGSQSRLGAGDKLTLGQLRAELDGDRQAAYRMVRAFTELTPSQGATTHLALRASKLGRYRETLEILARVHPASPEMVGLWWYWREVNTSHHLLGQHDQELASARKARNQYPDLLSSLWFEARALSALGRVDEVNQLLDQSVNFPPQAGYTPGLVALWSGQELFAHGDSVAAKTVIDRAVSWFQGLPEAERSSELMSYGEALYHGREVAKAAEVFERACFTAPNTPECLGWAGVVKARLGQRDQAVALREAISRTDSTPRVRIAMQAYWQARITAVLGDRESAVDLLRRAFTHGLAQFYIHPGSDYDFLTLRDYPPFKDLIKPKD